MVIIELFGLFYLFIYYVRSSILFQYCLGAYISETVRARDFNFGISHAYKTLVLVFECSPNEEYRVTRAFFRLKPRNLVTDLVLMMS